VTDGIRDFTSTVPRWVPYVTPVRFDAASAEQLDAMKITPSNKKISDYVLTLAHDPESLAVRSPLFNAIMYGKDGLSSAERELGALAASVLNRCIYCAAVHSSRYLQLTNRAEVVDTIFADGIEADLDDHSQALFDFAVSLSRTPPAATSEHIAALMDVGLSELEILDLILSASIFGWANRLMHTLGEPVAT